MRLLQLRLAPYGPFEDLTLDFQAGAHLHVIHGPNGAGKSTTLDALRSVLFGMSVGARSFRFDSARLRLGAVLERGNGERLAYTRRTSPKAPLWSADDTEALPEELLAPYLGRFDRQQYVQVFGLDIETLTAGGRDLLQGHGDLGRALFGAALGGKRLAQVERFLEEQTRALFAERSPKARLNLQRASYDDTQRALKAAQLSVNAADNDRRELARLRRQSSELRQELQRLEAARAELQDLASALAALQPLETKRAQRSALGEFSLLDPATSQAVGAAWADLQELRRTSSEREERLHAMRAERSSLLAAARPSVTDASAAIEELAARRGEFRAEARALASARQALAKATAERDAALLRAGLTAVQAESIADTKDEVAAQLERLTENRRSAAEAFQRAETEALRANAKRDVSRTALAELSSTLSARHAGELAELAPFRGDLEALLALTLPAEGAEAAAAAAWLAARQHRDAAAERAAQAEEERVALLEQLMRLTEGPTGAPPTRAEVTAARDARDVALRQMLEAAADQAQRPFGALAAHDLTVLVSQADDLADRLTADAERSAQRSEYEAQERRCRQLAEELQQRLTQATRDEDEARGAWNRMWASAGLSFDDVDAARLWQARRAALVQVYRSAHERASAAALDSAEAAALRGAELASAAETLKRREAEWATWASANGFSETDDSDRLRQRIRAMAEARQAAQLVASRSLEVADIGTRQRDFAENVAALVTRAEVALAPERVVQILQAPDSETMLVEERVTALVQALERERFRARALGEVEQRIAQETQLADHAAQRESALLAVLRGAAAQAGLEAPEDVVACAERSDAARALDADLLLLSASFAQHADGRSAEDVRAALNDRTAATLRLERETLSAEIARRAAELEELNNRCGALAATVEGPGSDRAAALEAERATLEASIEETALEFLELTVARELLHREVDRYRRETQGPLLRRARDLFEKLTLGAYTQLHPSEERGKTVMVARREDGETVGVEGMSTGTRDQLYLALRVATVEHMLTVHEPLPFLADDLFVNFDDARTEAALEVLAELGRRTQVIVFTHHENVARSAQALGARGIDLAVDLLELPGEVERTLGRRRPENSSNS